VFSLRSPRNAVKAYGATLTNPTVLALCNLMRFRLHVEVQMELVRVRSQVNLWKLLPFVLEPSFNYV
jgi:hypothetical protein